ncbi:MAG TPA: zf-HC2 domain-containing protein [Flavipsychrobacter sp.]|nr:zf-HC2 domain-containing protein [Flavipsychrobacter sp.]
MNQQLSHIFDKSACLTRRQIKDYLDGSMTPEECHAVEHHLNDCIFCSEAVDGMLDTRYEAAETVAELDTSFLNEHFHSITPQVHLNSLAPSQAIAIHKHKNKMQPVWSTTSIAVAVLVSLGVVWYVEYGKDKAVKSKTGLIPLVAPARTTIVHSGSSESNATNSVSSTPANVSSNINKAQPLQSGKIQENTSNNNTPPSTNSDNTNGGGGPQRIQPLITTGKEILQPDTDLEKAPVIKPINDVKDKTAYKNINSDEDDDETIPVSHAGMEQGIKLYNNQNYSAALKEFRRGMNNVDISERHDAAIMAARCYISLGQKENAQKLLQSVIDEGGPGKRIAKKTLRSLNNSEE